MLHPDGLSVNKLRKFFGGVQPKMMHNMPLSSVYLEINIQLFVVTTLQPHVLVEDVLLRMGTMRIPPGRTHIGGKQFAEVFQKLFINTLVFWCIGIIHQPDERTEDQKRKTSLVYLKRRQKRLLIYVFCEDEEA
jgi:hypothetical protein